MGLFDFLGGDPQYSVSYGLPGAPDVAVPQAAPAQQFQSQVPHGWKNVLGMIGDALLSANGRQPIYGPRVQQMRQAEQQAQLGQSIANYLGNTDAGLAQIFAADPNAGMALYKMKHPEDTPATALQRNYEFMAGKDPKLADQYLHGQAEGPPLIANNGDGTFTIIPRSMVGGQQATGAKEVTATGPNGEKIRLNPQTNQWEPAGGATDSTPSLPFR